MTPTLLLLVFHAVVGVALALDLGVFHRRAHAVGTREAAVWSAVWVALGLTFGAAIFVVVGPKAGTEYVTAYLVEKALSVDNLFVFVLVFGYFRVAPEHQHRVLFWGVLGAIVMRATLIAGGTALVHAFHGVLYLFGAILVWSGIKMARADDTGIEPDKNPVLRVIRQFLPVTTEARGAALWVREPDASGRMRTLFTPLFVVLVFVELTDLVFAVDSIPAVFAVTRDGMVAYTSNIFAILGLRSLYFLLAAVLHRLRFLKLGLAAVLVFVGGKMLLADVVHLEPAVSLTIVASLLGLSTLASLALPKREVEPAPALAEQPAEVPDDTQR